ncbi:MAG TPA: response regulator [Candidatus Cloacimonadota bacterium]|jgi:CheY-like chemotaxis protein|nr:response regulator [Candidatus Cloacimonadota bacterium]HPM00796.1 response regulator [Candidatus Cloacimonadota bacterium]
MSNQGEMRMDKEVTILIADDDEGHADLIRRNLLRAGIVNPIKYFKDGQDIIDFLFQRGSGDHLINGNAYVLLLDIRMPKMDGVEVLQEIKKDEKLKKMPVVMITTTDDPREVEACHLIGCNNYITKPVEYESFVNAIKQLGLFLAVVQIPVIN